MRCQLRDRGHAVLGSHLVSGVQRRLNTASLVPGAGSNVGWGGDPQQSPL